MQQIMNHSLRQHLPTLKEFDEVQANAVNFGERISVFAPPADIRQYRNNIAHDMDLRRQISELEARLSNQNKCQRIANEVTQELRHNS